MPTSSSSLAKFEGSFYVRKVLTEKERGFSIFSPHPERADPLISFFRVCERRCGAWRCRAEIGQNVTGSVKGHFLPRRSQEGANLLLWHIAPEFALSGGD